MRSTMLSGTARLLYLLANISRANCIKSVLRKTPHRLLPKWGSPAKVYGGRFQLLLNVQALLLYAQMMEERAHRLNDLALRVPYAEWRNECRRMAQNELNEAQSLRDRATKIETQQTAYLLEEAS